MQIYHFHAVQVACLDESDNQCWTVGFGDDLSPDPKKKVILQRSYSQDEQGTDMDTSYFLVGDRTLSGYGGFRETVLTHHQLEIHFSNQLSHRCKMEKVRINFKLSEGQFNELADYLNKVLSRSDCQFRIIRD